MNTDINILYNFKNPIRHFTNLENLSFPNSSLQLTDLCWTEPIKFRIWKNNNKYRMLKLPNILNFQQAVIKYKDLSNFTNPSLFDSERKRLIPNLDTGDFAAGKYDEQIERDFYYLTVYDYLLKLDIKAFYERIYAHDIDFGPNRENFLTNMNLGATNGFIMGNYLSLYFAEKYLAIISEDIKKALIDNNLDVKFSYFSDDFYFFCNKSEKEKVVNIFEKVLEEYSLERKENIELWSYLEYNEQNIAERYWKKIISESKERFKDEKEDNNAYFTNQLIYRASNIPNEKYKRTFLNTFFKSNFFNNIDIKKYKMEIHNFHNILYIYKFSPETLLYSINKFKKLDIFKSHDFQEFLASRFKNSLVASFNEQQLYYYFAIKNLGFKKILRENREYILKTDNQFLISYCLKDKIFTKKNIEFLKKKKDERYWFQNYHLILYTDLINNLEEEIKEYLIPKLATKERQKENYMNFYKENLISRVSLIKSIKDVNKNIEKYKQNLMEEREDTF